MGISVILPSVRPHLLARAFASIAAACGAVPYEVIVVADFGPELWPGCTWIRRERRGVIDAVVVGEAAAREDFLFLFNDESVLEAGALEQLHAAAVLDPLTLWSPRHEPAFPFVYFALPFAPFPFAHRQLLKALGGLLDPAYRGFYADPDLSMRAHEAGVPIRIVESAVLHHDNRHDDAHRQAVSAYVAQDRETFGRRWGHLGELVDP